LLLALLSCTALVPSHDKTLKTELQTNDKGEIEFPVFTNGRWMISAVKNRYLGSLTWGYLK
jgi:hypothetical protein